jgi:hypothetical protein
MVMGLNGYGSAFWLLGAWGILAAGPALAQVPKVQDQTAPPPAYPSVDVPGTQPAGTPAARPTARVAPQPKAPIQRAAATSAKGFADEHVALIRSSLMALNQANITGNYVVLHALGTPQFRQESGVEKLAGAFATFRQQNLDLVPTTVLAPQSVRPAQIDTNGNLRLIGVFPSKPLQVRFDLAYRQVEGRWMHAGLGVSAVPVNAPPVPPAAPPAAGPQAKAVPPSGATKAGIQPATAKAAAQPASKAPAKP